MLDGRTRTLPINLLATYVPLQATPIVIITIQLLVKYTTGIYPLK